MEHSQSSNKRSVPDSSPEQNPQSEKQINLNYTPVRDPAQPRPPALTHVVNETHLPPHTPGRQITYHNLDNGKDAHGSAPTMYNHQHPVSNARKSLDGRLASNTNRQSEGFRDCPPCPPWAKDLMDRFSSLQSSVVEAKKSTAIKLDSLTENITSLRTSLDTITTRVSTIEKDVKQISAITFRLKQIEESTQFVSDEYDRLSDSVKTHTSDIRQIQTVTNVMEKDLNKLHSRIVAQEQKSMQDNLLFFGIPEGDRENTEDVLHDFINKNLPSVPRQNQPISVERCHRIGPRNQQNKSKVRPIVAKFSSYKSRELVRRSASDLKNTNFGIREQFPQEVLEKRRILQPKFREARQKNMHAVFRDDTLRIENKEFAVNNHGEIYQTSRVFHYIHRQHEHPLSHNRNADLNNPSSQSPNERQSSRDNSSSWIPRSAEDQNRTYRSRDNGFQQMDTQGANQHLPRPGSNSQCQSNRY